MIIDRFSDSWRVVALWASQELDKAIEQISQTGVSIIETETLRGRIATLQELLDMEADPAELVAEPSIDYGFQGADDVG